MEKGYGMGHSPSRRPEVYIYFTLQGARRVSSSHYSSLDWKSDIVRRRDITSVQIYATALCLLEIKKNDGSRNNLIFSTSYLAPVKRKTQRFRTDSQCVLHWLRSVKSL